MLHLGKGPLFPFLCSCGVACLCLFLVLVGSSGLVVGYGGSGR